MAVGKGSMERAAKAAEQKTESGEKETAAVKTGQAKGGQAKASSAKKTSSGKKVTAKTIAAPKEEVLEKIVYQKSSGVLERDARPNESFGLGDEMPVYFL